RGADVVHRAVAWLNDHSHGAFFLWVHLYDPHDPYDPPEPYKSRYASEPYDGEIAYADAAFGELMNWLRAHDLYDGALIAVMADHGEAFGEHGEQAHGVFLYDETIHVPLLFKLAANRFAGRKIDSRVGLVDIAPTILREAGLDVPNTMQGQSLASIMKPAVQSAAMAKDRSIYSETDYPHSAFGWSPLRSLRVGKYLYVHAPEPELYDQVAD